MSNKRFNEKCKVKSRDRDLLHVSQDVHATAEEFLAFLAVQLVDECCRVIRVGILIPATFQC